MSVSCVRHCGSCLFFLSHVRPDPVSVCRHTGFETVCRGAASIICQKFVIWMNIQIFRIKQLFTRGEAVDSNNRPNRRRSCRCCRCIEDYWTADVTLLHKYNTSRVTFIGLAAIEKWITWIVINYEDKFIICTYWTCVYTSISTRNTEIVGCNKSPIAILRPAVLVISHNRNFSLFVGVGGAWISFGWNEMLQHI